MFSSKWEYTHIYAEYCHLKNAADERCRDYYGNEKTDGRMSKTILVAEDEGLLRRLIERVLVKNGYNVVLAQDGEEALKLLEKHSVDIALLDVNMPHKSGLVVLTVIQTQYKNIKTILTSGDIDNVYEFDVRKRPSYYLAKPFRMEQLLNLL